MKSLTPKGLMDRTQNMSVHLHSKIKHMINMSVLGRMFFTLSAAAATAMSIKNFKFSVVTDLTNLICSGVARQKKEEF